MKRMQCLSIAKATNAQCEKKALLGGTYCWIHTPKRDPFVFLIIGALLGFGVQAVYDNFTVSPEESLIIDLQHQIQGYQESIEVKDQKITELKNTTEQAQLEIQKLKDKQAPWKLSENQETIFRNRLKLAEKGKIEIGYFLSDGQRAGAFTKRLEEIFRESGYDMAPEIAMVTNTVNPTGNHIKYRKVEDRNRAKEYTLIFNELGIPCKYGKIGDNHVDLWGAWRTL